MSTVFVSSALLALAAQAKQAAPPRADALLAKIPAGLTVKDSFERLNNREDSRPCSTLVWSPDGTRVAYVAHRGDDMLPVVGSEVGEAYEWVQNPVFADAHVFFVAAQRLEPSARGTTYHCWVLIDGKKVGPEDMIWGLGVRADGKKAAYWTGPGWSTFSTEASKPVRLVIASEADTGHWSVERDAEWSSPPTLSPLFSDDGKRVITWATPWENVKGTKGAKGVQLRPLRPASPDDEVVLIERGKRDTWLCLPVPRIDSIAISRDGSVQALLVGGAKLAARARNPKDTELYFKNKPVGLAYKEIEMPAVDPAGKHFACVVASGTGRTVAVDDEKTLAGSYDHILELAFDAQGRRIAFVANTGGKLDEQGWVEGGECFVVVRSVEGDPALHEQAHFKEVQNLAWDPQGERVACRVRDASGWRVAYGEALSDPHDEVGRPQFTANELGFGSRDKSELWWRVFRRP